MKNDELAAYLASLERDECYRVDETLKESGHETTQRVFFVGRNGAEIGPFVRKIIALDAHMGQAYKTIFQAQASGKRFRHLPRIYECYRTDTHLVVVMEFVHGETLQDAVYRRDPSPQLAKEVFPSLCEAVAELHERFDPPLIHRDLKPSNVILADGEPVLIDFGIARAFRPEAGADTTRFGTCGYAPPEQFGYGQTDKRSDVYALGMLLYYCLTERTPRSENRRDIIDDPAVPSPLSGVIARAIEFDPERRYPDVCALLAGFAAACAKAGGGGAPEEGGANHPAASASGSLASPPAVPLAPETSASARPHATENVPAPAEAKPRKRPARPRWLTVRNIVCLCYYVLFAISAVSLIVSPTGNALAYPLPNRIISYGGLFVVGNAAVAYLLCDKRALRESFPALARFSGRPERLVCAAVIGASVVAAGVSGSFVQPS